MLGRPRGARGAGPRPTLGRRSPSSGTGSGRRSPTLADDAQDAVFVGQLADFSVGSKPEFWLVMQHRCWVSPFDVHGERQPFEALPKTIPQRVDDRWRSLAGAVRDAGGYAQENEPCAEWLCADFLRRRLDAALPARDFKAATLRRRLHSGNSVGAEIGPHRGSCASAWRAGRPGPSVSAWPSRRCRPWASLWASRWASRWAGHGRWVTHAEARPVSGLETGRRVADNSVFAGGSGCASSRRSRAAAVGR